MGLCDFTRRPIEFAFGIENGKSIYDFATEENLHMNMYAKSKSFKSEL